jgi:hypothetical protein
MFREALIDIIGRLERAKQNGLLHGYALIGGFAIAAWGLPRATQDIDFALDLGGADPSVLADALGGRYRPGAPDDPLAGVITLSVQVSGQAIPIELVLLPARWTRVLFKQVQPLHTLDCSVPVVSWQPLILLKLYAGGPQDLIDAERLLVVQRPDGDTLQKLHTLAETVGLSRAFTDLLTRITDVS